MNAPTAQMRIRHAAAGEAVREDTVPLADAPALIEQLHRQGRVVLSTHAAKGSRIERWLGNRTAGRRLTLLCRELRTLLAAGMTVVEAIETLQARSRLEHREHALVDLIANGLRRGQSLSATLAHIEHCPPVLVAAVKAGERTSDLVRSLDEYLRFDGLLARLRSRVISAAIYPALVSLVGLTISVFLLLVVMPNFAAMYENLRTGPTEAMATGMQLARWVAIHRWAVWAILGTMAAAILLWIGTGAARRQLTALARQVPYIDQRLLDFELALLYQAVALLLQGGYPLPEALRVALTSALSRRVSASLEQVASTVDRGKPVAEALAGAGLCDEVGRRLLAAGERNGQFARVAEAVAELHADRFERFIERLTRIVEPVLLFAVSLMVGGIVLVMYMPVIDLATQLR